MAGGIALLESIFISLHIIIMMTMYVFSPDDFLNVMGSQTGFCIYTVEPLYCGHLGELMNVLTFFIEKCFYFRDNLKVFVLRGVLIAGVSFV